MKTFVVLVDFINLAQLLDVLLCLLHRFDFVAIGRRCDQPSVRMYATCMGLLVYVAAVVVVEVESLARHIFLSLLTLS